MPVYNVEEYLPQCVDSVLRQTYQNFEVILVDDGSPDNCPVLCDKYAVADPRVRVIHKENGGLSSARQAGLSAVTGEYLLFVDGDDWIEPDTLDVCVTNAVQNSSDCVLFDYIREYEAKSLPSHLFEAPFSYDSEESEQQIHRRIVGFLPEELTAPQRIDALSTTCMKLYRTEVARNGRIVSERVVGTSEDAIFNLYALDGCKVSYVHRCLYHYRKTNTHSITSQHKADLSEKWDAMYSIFQEYIESSDHADSYQAVFLNRVACGMIGLGLNEAGSSAGLLQKSQKLKSILQKPLYREAFNQLDITFCPLKWKVFFLFCKTRSTLFLAVLLQLMNYLRSRMAE